MKKLSTYINESIKHLPNHLSGIIVFDIDDTLLKVNPNIIKIYKKTPDGEIGLSTEEYANDPDAGIPSKKHLFDLRDFRNPTKVYNSIISGIPLVNNLKIMDSYIEAGYDFCFLTARSCEETVKRALNDFLMVKDPFTGELKKLGDIFKKTLSHAVNDEYKNYPGHSDSDKKANVLKDLCKKYDKVVFVDDDEKNINSAKSLNINNLTVIKAQKY